MSLLITHNEADKQFSAVLDGKTSVLRYNVTDDGKTLDYYSTFVPPELRGRNIGQDIVLFALEYAKLNHFKIIPSCPFVNKVLERHSEYSSLRA